MIASIPFEGFYQSAHEAAIDDALEQEFDGNAGLTNASSPRRTSCMRPNTQHDSARSTGSRASFTAYGPPVNTTS